MATEQALDQLERTVLFKLSLLCEGQSSSVDKPSIRHLHAESCYPPGFDETLQSDLRPETSLWAYHHRRLTDCRERGPQARLRAIVEAHRDLDTSQKRPPCYISPDSSQNAEERDEAIMRWQGYEPEWPAVYESCSVAYVCRLRRKRNANPMTGEPIFVVA